MIIEHFGKKFYVDNKLAEDINIYIDDMITDEEDILIPIVGLEGSGKSKFSRQIAWYCSYYLHTKHNILLLPTFEDIHFNLMDYMKRSLNGKKFQINIMDESRKILNRKRSTGKEAVHFTDYLSECRDAQQIHLILLPAFHDLEKYVLLWRAKFLIKCEKFRDKTTKKLVKGEGKVLPIDDRLIYCWEENRYRYPTFNPKKYGGYQITFNNYEAFEDYDKYKDKKARYRLKKYADDGKESNPYYERDKIILNMKKNGLTDIEIAKSVGLTRQRVYQILKEHVK